MLEFRRCQPSKVVADPYRAFGQPIFEGSRTRVRDVANMLNAGEDPQVVADELGVSLEGPDRFITIRTLEAGSGHAGGSSVVRPGRWSLRPARRLEPNELIGSWLEGLPD